MLVVVVLTIEKQTVPFTNVPLVISSKLDLYYTTRVANGGLLLKYTEGITFIFIPYKSNTFIP